MKGCNRFQGGAGRAEGASEVVYQLLKKDDQIILCKPNGSNPTQL